MPEFTIILVGFDRKNLCAIIEPVYVPGALDQEQAGCLAAEGYESKTGISVQALYAAAGRINLEKLTQKDVFI